MRIALPSLVALALACAAPALRAQPPVTLEAETDHELYDYDARNKIYLEARVRTSAPTGDSTASVRNIVLVLDRSGSMSGAPIKALRQALVASFHALADRDIVSVVTFGSEVETLLEAVPGEQVRDLDSLVARLEPAGGAALYDALNQGAALLRRCASPSTINHLVLVTNGRPTKGPREMADFSRVAEIFAREGTTISTIGLGPDFNEDLLATIARIGNGRFQYVDQPEKLPDALQAEVAPRRTIVARDAVLTVTFTSDCDNIESYGWEPAEIADQVVTYRLPYLFVAQDITVLASAKMVPRSFRRNLATVRLRWRDLGDGTPRELKQAVEVIFDSDSRLARLSVNRAVARTSVSTLISEGMQEAIEQLDKGDFRRALRALRTARDNARRFNDELEDQQIATKIRQLEAYLAEVQSRGLNQLDRKILRSGLFNQFDTPAESHPDN